MFMDMEKTSSLGGEEKVPRLVPPQYGRLHEEKLEALEGSSSHLDEGVRKARSGSEIFGECGESLRVLGCFFFGGEPLGVFVGLVGVLSRGKAKRSIHLPQNESQTTHDPKTDSSRMYLKPFNQSPCNTSNSKGFLEGSL